MILSNQNHWSRIKISFCPSFVIQCFFNVVHSYKMNTGCTASSVYKYISLYINHNLSFLSIFYLDILSLLLFTVHYYLILLDFFLSVCESLMNSVIIFLFNLYFGFLSHYPHNFCLAWISKEPTSQSFYF